jgi:hypothetical protein
MLDARMWANAVLLYILDSFVHLNGMNKLFENYKVKSSQY